jgi:hypothetical protein
MQLPHFQTPGQFLKQYFKENPEALKSYVGYGLKAVHLAVTPLNLALRHLIEIQGKNPDEEPGRKMREDFQLALDNIFRRFHDHSYDEDFDFSYLNKKFEEARKNNGFEPFNLSKDEYRELTDLSKVASPPPVHTAPPFDVPATRTITEAGVPVTIDQTPLQELAAFLSVPIVNPSASEPTEHERDVSLKDSSGDDFATKGYSAQHLKDALQTLSRLAKTWEDPSDPQAAVQQILMFEKELEESEDPNKLMARTEELKELREFLKRTDSAPRPLKKVGKIRRTKTGKTDAVKKVPRKSPKTTSKTLNRSLAQSEKDAEAIQKLVLEGKLDPKDLNLLIGEGLDPKAVELWKEKYSRVKQEWIPGSTFQSGSFSRPNQKRK